MGLKAKLVFEKGCLCDLKCCKDEGACCCNDEKLRGIKGIYPERASVVGTFWGTNERTMVLVAIDELSRIVPVDELCSTNTVIS